MNKNHLVAAIAADSGLTQKEVTAVLSALGRVASAALTERMAVSLPEIGKLKLSRREARTGRNPKTGAPVEIAAKNTVKFTAAKTLKDAVI